MTATFVPWSPGWQLLSVVLIIATSIWTVATVVETPRLFWVQNVGSVVPTLVATVFIAYALERERAAKLRAESERELRETRRRAQGVIKAMEAAEKRVDPVLQPLRDRVLFLKHNLNAAAIGALDMELLALRTNVDTLVADLESSIAESEAFLAEMDAAAKAAS